MPAPGRSLRRFQSWPGVCLATPIVVIRAILARRGPKGTAMARSPSRGNLTEPATLTDAVDSVDAVFLTSADSICSLVLTSRRARVAPAEARA